ncbi:MAG: FAD-dependent oxidoreductase [Breznakia sp.]
MKVIIIGAVAAGMSTAAKLKRNIGDDVEIRVYEKGDEVSYGACGLPFYISNVIKEADDLFAKPISQFEASGIALCIHHEVLKVDEKQKKLTIKNLENDEVFEDSYDYLVVGSGARRRRLGLFGEDSDNVLGVHSVYEAKKIKQFLQKDEVQDVVIIGGGFVGMEMLEACKHYGKNVYVIESNKQIFTSVDEDIAMQMMDIIKEQHIHVLLETKVQKIQASNNFVHTLVYEQKGKHYELHVDLIISAIGSIPNTEFLSSVDKLENGAVLVRDTMQTSDPFIYAAGDCSVMKSAITQTYRYAPLGTNANKQGKIIADVLAKKKSKPFKLLHSTALKLFDYNVAKIGISKRDAVHLDCDIEDHSVVANAYASYYGKEKLMIKVSYNVHSRVIVGVQCIGKGSVVERANYYVIAIYSGLTLDEMGMMDLAYSPPFGGVWDAALIAANAVK